jgi:hypothetical protein
MRSTEDVVIADNEGKPFGVENPEFAKQISASDQVTLVRIAREIPGQYDMIGVLNFQGMHEDCTEPVKVLRMKSLVYMRVGNMGDLKHEAILSMVCTETEDVRDFQQYQTKIWPAASRSPIPFPLTNQ